MLGLTLALILVAPAQLEVDPDYQKGRELYRELEFEQAVFRFQALAIKPSLTREEQAQAFLWLGLCYAGVPNNELAAQAFRDALRLHPEARLPIENPPPAVLEMFQAANPTAKPASTPPAEDPPPPEDPAAPGVDDTPSTSPPQGNGSTTTDPVPSSPTTAAPAAGGPAFLWTGLGLLGGAAGVGMLGLVAGSASAVAYVYALSVAAGSGDAGTVNLLVLVSRIALGVGVAALVGAGLVGAAGGAVLAYDTVAGE